MSGHVRELLSAYLDDQLGATERSRVAAHLAECPACAARLSELALVDAAVSELGLPETKDDQAFAARVRARIEAEDQHASARQLGRPATRYPAWVWAAAAALVLAVMTPLMLRELRPVAEPGAPEAAGPRVAQAPGPALAADALPRGKGAASEPASLGQRKASAVPARPRAQASPPQLVSASAEATPPTPAATRDRETLGREAAPAVARVPAPAPAVASLETAKGEVAGGVVGGVVGGVADTGIAEGRAPAAADRGIATLQERVEPGERLEKELQPRAKAAAPAPPAADAFAGRPASPAVAALFARLAAQQPGTPTEWRQLREAWRELARAHSTEPLADEALVRAIEAAAGAYRASADARDERVLERDVAEYLARPGASQADRVRRVLREAKH